MGWHVERAIVEAICPELKQTRDQIAGIAGVHPNTFDHHIPSLIDSGVVVRVGAGRRGSYQYLVDKEKARELGYLA